MMREETADFRQFIFMVVGGAVVVLGAIFTFFAGIFSFLGLKTASGAREKYELMLAKQIDKTDKQIDASIKAAASELIATKVAEFHAKVDEAFAQIQSNMTELEDSFNQRKTYIDRWLGSLANPPGEHLNFQQWMPGKRVLWVDDHPEYNTDMRGLLTSTGKASVDIAVSTGDAMRRIDDSAQYNIIISDMNRESDPEAGINFVALLKQKNITVPTVICTGSNRLQSLGKKAMSEGAYAVVASDPGLVRAMISAIRGHPPTGIEES
jgi:CheY-like chemotaxis protein